MSARGSPEDEATSWRRSLSHDSRRKTSWREVGLREGKMVLCHMPSVSEKEVAVRASGSPVGGRPDLSVTWYLRGILDGGIV